MDDQEGLVNDEDRERSNLSLRELAHRELLLEQAEHEANRERLPSMTFERVGMCLDTPVLGPTDTLNLPFDYQMHSLTKNESLLDHAQLSFLPGTELYSKR